MIECRRRFRCYAGTLVAAERCVGRLGKNGVSDVARGIGELVGGLNAPSHR